MRYKNIKDQQKPIIVIVTLALLSMIPIWLSGCGNNSPVDRGDVFSAVEQTISKPGPVRDNLIERGLVTLASQGENTSNPVSGNIKIGEIEQMVEEGIYIIDEDGYLQFGPSYVEKPTSVTIGTRFFRSDEFYLEVQLPEGWAAAEGPESLVPTGHLQGQVAFNSWGQEGFWARAVDPYGSVKSYRYGPEEVMSQIPEGGAYVALTLVSGPPRLLAPEPPEYTQSDLSGLYQPHDWRQDSATSAQFMPFYKWGRDLELVVACHPDASDETVARLNDLLQSWRFDDFPVGDEEWAGLQARKALPDSVEPFIFPNRSGRMGNRGTQIEEQGEVVHVRFIYYPEEPPHNLDFFACPADLCHWWEIDVLPTGEAVLIDEGGAKLPEK